MSNVRNQNFVFLLYRLVENFILRKNPKKNFRNFIGYLYNPVLPEALIFRKKRFFHIFQKLRAFKTFFKQIHIYHKKQYYYLKFWLISIIYADFVAVLV